MNRGIKMQIRLTQEGKKKRQYKETSSEITEGSRELTQE